MAHVLTACAVILFHLIVAVILILCRHYLTRCCDWAFLEVTPPEEGPINLEELQKLWRSPGDGAECVEFSSEGGWRLAGTSCTRRPAGG